MKLTSLLQLVDKLEQIGKIDNLQQVYGILTPYIFLLWICLATDILQHIPILCSDVVRSVLSDKTQ